MDDHVHLLKGIVKCGACGMAMTPYPAGKKGRDGKPYLYYACTSVTQDGSASSCPVRSVPAREFESLIKSVLVDLGSDEAVLKACVDAANREALVSVEELQERQRRNHDEIARLTVGIRRIIEIMKETDLLSPDVKAEYKRLIQEKERLGTAIEKLQMDIDRRERKVLDAEVIRRSLVDFERLVNLLPVQDQKELFQLLLREVQVHPFDPEQDNPPDGAAGALATKVRSKWYRVEITLHQLPGLGLGERFRGGSSDKRGSGSPNRGKIRTFLSVDVALKVDCNKKPTFGEKRHYFAWDEAAMGAERQSTSATSGRANPVHRARQWKASMEERGESRADLARRLGVSRARVTQVLQVLDLNPAALELIERMPGAAVVSERGLRALKKGPPEAQAECMRALLGRGIARSNRRRDLRSLAPDGGSRAPNPTTVGL